MKRRQLLAGLASAALGFTAWRYWPEDGLTNPCPEGPLPASLANDPLVGAAWRGIDPTAFWDCHVHLIGSGDSGSGIWINPDMSSLRHPIQRVQRFFYQNASCLEGRSEVDHAFVDRLLTLHEAFPAGTRLMLLAFDYFHDEKGNRIKQASSFYVPNEYARMTANRHPRHFEWIASIHPNRPDAVDALLRAVETGARAVKWLPAAQGIDPASAACDPFYRTMAEHDIPLLTHAGTELAVKGGNKEDFGNALRLRRPLEQGVRVLVAHCASLGEGLDVDRKIGKRYVDSFELFARIMEAPDYTDRLFGEISGITQINRFRNGLETLVTRSDWHNRLVNGSDYPLPGVLPLISLKQLVRKGYLKHEEVNTLIQIRRYNPLLFDFVLKRSLRVEGTRFGSAVFESRRVFQTFSTVGRSAYR